MRNLAIFVALAIAALTPAQDKAPFKRVVKEGDTTKYKLMVDTEFGGMKLRYTANIVEKTVKVADDGGYSVTSEHQDAMISMDGTEQPAGGAVGAPTTTVFNADGSVAELQGDQTGPEAYRMANLQCFLFPADPVAVGTKWESEIKGNADKGTVNVKYTYEISSKETVQGRECYKVEVSCAEQSGDNPASAKGSAWMDIASGVLVKLDSDWTNAPIAGQVISGKVHMELAG